MLPGSVNRGVALDDLRPAGQVISKDAGFRSGVGESKERRCQSEDQSETEILKSPCAVECSCAVDEK